MRWLSQEVLKPRCELGEERVHSLELSVDCINCEKTPVLAPAFLASNSLCASSLAKQERLFLQNGFTSLGWPLGKQLP